MENMLMARRRSRTLTEVELEFMKIVWDSAEVAASDIRGTLAKRGRHLADGAIRRVLSIMLEKGYLICRKDGKAFLYLANISREQTRGSMVGDLLSGLFDGSESLVVAALLDRKDVTREELEKIKRLIREREKGDET
jgi:BlaI family transcriptional regulator, penicillinase repressor